MVNFYVEKVSICNQYTKKGNKKGKVTTYRRILISKLMNLKGCQKVQNKNTAKTIKRVACLPHYQFIAKTGD